MRSTMRQFSFFRNRSLLVGLGLFVFALALRLYRLDAQSLWLDEGGTWAEVTGQTGKGWLKLISELFSPDAGYPLYHLILKGWVSLAGDSEWALRFPSALASALAVVALWRAATLLFALPPRHPSLLALGALAALSPYALWHAQDAKAYSMLFLAIACTIWLLAGAYQQPGRQRWMYVAAAALISLFVHRLALLPVAGVGLAIAFTHPRIQPNWRIAGAILALLFGLVGISGTIRAAAAERAIAGRSGVGPLTGLGLTFVRFSVDRWPGEIDRYLGMPLLIWLLPAILLGLLGLWQLIRDARRGSTPAIIILCLLVVPIVLLSALLALAPVFESRYAMVAFPGWLLTICYPLLTRTTPSQSTNRVRMVALTNGLFGLLLVLGTISLFQPAKGLFSGDPLKEQWREAVQAVAASAQPDDLLLIHPYYVAEMYQYYAPRITPDRLPTPATFPVFAEGDTCGASSPADIRICWQRRYEPFFNTQAKGKKRALLLIAPDHAATVDPPKTLAELIAETPASQPPPTQGDRYGWVGLRFQYPQKTWPCGGTGNALIGVELMCQSFPETFTAVAGEHGQIPQPAVPLQAVFGGQIGLRGYTIALHGGVARPGGTLPITLYWAASAKPTSDYRMFLHLCRDCAQPPLANADSMPLAGYPPAGRTTTWRIGDPVHDERALTLPRILPPGRYTLLLGIYPADQNPPTRLDIRTTATDRVLPANRLILTQIDIAP